MLVEGFPDLLVFYGIYLPPLYGLCVDSATLGEFNHRVADYIYISEFTTSIWMRYEEHLDLLSGAEHQLYRLVQSIGSWRRSRAGRALLGLVCHTVY